MEEEKNNEVNIENPSPEEKETLKDKFSDFTKWSLEKIDQGKDYILERTPELLDAAKDKAGEAADKAKETIDELTEKVHQAKLKADKNKYKPIFEDDLDGLHYKSVICIKDHDKRQGIEACNDAIGFYGKSKEVEYIAFYRKNARNVGIYFNPEPKEGIYYSHPTKKNYYINIDEYFNYLHKARVAELEKIAKSLGATHFKVEIQEKKKSEIIVNNKLSANVKTKKKGAGAEAKVKINENDYYFVGIAAESRYAGKEPVRPELNLWKNDEDINSLIELRMDPNNPLTFKSYDLKYNTSTGIDIDTALKLDAAIPLMKVKAAANVAYHAAQETERYLKYIIEF